MKNDPRGDLPELRLGHFPLGDQAEAESGGIEMSNGAVGQMARRQYHGALYENAVMIRQLALSTCESCLKILQTDNDPIVEAVLTANIRALAGIIDMKGGFMSWQDNEGLDRLYALEPWRHGLFVRSALLELAKMVTLHPPTLDMLFHLAVRSKEELEAARRRGSIAYPQESELLESVERLATEQYIRFSDRPVIEQFGFLPVLETWKGHDDASIRQLAEAVDRSCPPPHPW